MKKENLQGDEEFGAREKSQREMKREKERERDREKERDRERDKESGLSVHYGKHVCTPVSLLQLILKKVCPLHKLPRRS